MADTNSNGEDKPKVDPQKQYLIEQFGNLMEKVGEGYGGPLQEELIRRMEQTIADFDEEVSEMLESLRDNSVKRHEKLKEISEQNKIFEDRAENEKAILGDQINFDYSATVDGEKFEGSEGKGVQIELGKNLFLKGFDEKLIGVKKNDIKIIEDNAQAIGSSCRASRSGADTRHG